MKNFSIMQHHWPELERIDSIFFYTFYVLSLYIDFFYIFRSAYPFFLCLSQFIINKLEIIIDAKKKLKDFIIMFVSNLPL